MQQIIDDDSYHRCMSMKKVGVAPISSLAPAVALFRSLADSTRLAIVHRLADGEARVVD